MQNAVLLRASLAACLLHECGHLLMMYLLRQRVRSIDFYGVGIRIEADHSLYPWQQDILVLLAGPFCNLAAAGMMYAIGDTWERILAQCGIGLLNLLPYRHLDGGAALHLCIAFFSAVPERWERLLTVFCVLLSIVGIGYGMYMQVQNVTYYCFLLYLLFAEIFF